MSIELRSTAFEEGQRIPTKYTGEGEDVSPPLVWKGLPDGVQELALVCDDPDAPSPKKPNPDPWVHWVLYRVPANAAGLPENVGKGLDRPKEPAGAMQGKNSWPGGQTIGYRGPMPPPGSGTHRYVFRLYALDKKLDLAPAADKPALLAAIQGHVLAEGRLTGTYSR